MVTNTWSAGADGNWNVNGNWSRGHFPAAGEDVVFDATSKYKCTVNVQVAALNSVTLAAAFDTGIVTVSIAQNTTNAWGALTIHGGTLNTTVISSAYCTFSTTFTMDGGTVNTGTNNLNMSGSCNITGGTFSSGFIRFTTANAVTLSSTITLSGGIVCNTNNTVTLNSDITCTSFQVWGTANGNLATAVIGARALNCAGITTGVAATTRNGCITCTTGAVTCTSITITLANDYIDFGNSTWTNSGNITNASTSASWNAGGSTLNFTYLGARTYGFNNGNSANIKYNNLAWTGSSNQTLTWGANTVTILGNLTLGNTAGAHTLATNNPSLTISGGMTIANGCGFTKGTGTITFNGSGTYADNQASAANIRNLGTVVMNATGTLTLSTLWRMDTFTLTAGTLNVTATQSSSGYWGTTTINGGLVNASAGITAVRYSTFTMNGGTIGIGTSSVIGLGDISITAGTWTSGILRPQSATPVSLASAISLTSINCAMNNATVTQSGNITCLDFAIFGDAAGQTGTYDLGTNSLVASNSFVTGFTASDRYGVFTCGVGSSVSTGIVDIKLSGDYITFSNSTWTVTGSWTNNSTSASWNAGTSTINFTGTTAFSDANPQPLGAVVVNTAGTFTVGSQFKATSFTLTAGTVNVTTSQTTVDSWGAVTINGGTLNATLGNTAMRATTFTMGGSTVNIGATSLLITDGNMSLTAGTWTSGTLRPNGASSLASAITLTSIYCNLNNTTVTQSGTITCADLTILGQANGQRGTYAVGSNTLNATSITTGQGSTTRNGTITCLAAHVNVTGSLGINLADDYITFGSSIWNIHACSNHSTSASWNVGTATVTFNGTGNVTCSGTTLLPPVTINTAGTVTLIGELLATSTTLTAGQLTTRNQTIADSWGALTINGGTLYTHSVTNYSAVCRATDFTMSSGTVDVSSNPGGGGDVSVLFTGTANITGGTWLNGSCEARATTDKNFTATIPLTRVHFRGTGASTYTLLSNLTATFWGIGIQSNTNYTVKTLNTNGFTVTSPAVYLGGVWADPSDLSAGAVICGNSTFNVQDVSITKPESYFDMGTSTWNLTGSWYNEGTSASWSAGTSTVNMLGTTGTATVGNGTKSLYNLTVDAAGNVVTLTTGTVPAIMNKLWVKAGTCATADRIAATVSTFTAGCSWSFSGLGVNTITAGNLQVDSGATFNAGNPIYVKFGGVWGNPLEPVRCDGQVFV